MSQENNLLVAASGTGGHIFPALAISKNLEDYWIIHWLGVRQRFYGYIIPQKYILNFNCESFFHGLRFHVAS